MFEITLRREWKNFAAQYLQRTSFYLSLELFLFSPKVFRPSFADRFFEAESSAKVKPFSETTKSFFKIFQTFFLNLAFVFEAKAVAKVNQVFQITKRFFNFFSVELFQNFAFRIVSFPKAGAKISAFRANFQIFSELFFRLFRGPLTLHSVSNVYILKIFRNFSCGPLRPRVALGAAGPLPPEKRTGRAVRSDNSPCGFRSLSGHPPYFFFRNSPMPDGVAIVFL